MTVPLAISLAYQKKQFGGVPGQPDVLDCLVSPQATAVAAQTASVTDAQNVGVILSPNPMLDRRTQQRDTMLDFYDSASILRTEAGGS